MNAIGDPIPDGIIHEAMLADLAEPGESRPTNHYGEVTRPAACSGVTSMKMTVVNHRHLRLRKSTAQTLCEFIRAGFHL